MSVEREDDAGKNDCADGRPRALTAAALAFRAPSMCCRTTFLHRRAQLGPLIRSTYMHTHRWDRFEIRLELTGPLIEPFAVNVSCLIDQFAYVSIRIVLPENGNEEQIGSLVEAIPLSVSAWIKS